VTDVPIAGGNASQNSSIVDLGLTGDGTIGYTHLREFVWNIDRANGLDNAYGIRGFRPLAGWGHSYGNAYYCFSFGKVSDGSGHPKADTHEFRLQQSVTATRAPPL
jgi:hypothetical protein